MKILPKKLALLCLLLFALVSISAVVFGPGVSAATREDLIKQAECEEVQEIQCFQDAQDPAVNRDCASTGQECNIVDKYINPAIALVGILGGIAITIGIIIGGIQYASSGGDPQKAATGKQHIKKAVIALIGLLFLYAFIRFLMPSGTTG